MLELHYNFFKKCCDANKYEELGIDPDSLYLVLPEENLEKVILPEKRNKWNALRSGDCTDNFSANATDNFFPECVATHTRNTIRGNHVSLRENLEVQKSCADAVNCIVAMIEKVTSTSLAAKV